MFELGEFVIAVFDDRLVWPSQIKNIYYPGQYPCTFEVLLHRDLPTNRNQTRLLFTPQIYKLDDLFVDLMHLAFEVNDVALQDALFSALEEEQNRLFLSSSEGGVYPLNISENY